MNKITIPPAIIRIFFAVPSAPAVDIFINEFRFLQNVNYQDKSPFLSLPAGKYQIDIYPSGNHVSTILSKKIMVEQGKMYTLAACGTNEKMQLIPYDHSTSVPIGEAKIRIIHLAKSQQAIDLKATFGDVVFPNIMYKQASNYLGITPMTVDLEIREAGTKNVLLPLPRLQFKPNHIYSIVLLQSSQLEEPKLEAIVLKDYKVTFSRS